MTVFLTWAFKATNASTARTLPNRLADVVNVLDYGAVRDGVTNDAPAFQLAIDAAFGSAGSPHGTSSTLNRPLRIPYGNYSIQSPLVFTDVVGGYIVGDGARATFLVGNNNSIMTFNGCENTRISGFGTRPGSKSVVSGLHGIKLDAGAGAIGLSDVTVEEVACEGGQYGIRVAPGGVGGNNILLLRYFTTDIDVGLNIEGADSSVTYIGGGAADCNTGIWVQDGDCTCHCQFGGVTQLDIQHDSTGTTTAYALRSESRDFANVTDGTLIGIAILHQSAAVGYTLNITSPGVAKFTSCQFGQTSVPTQAYVTGTGSVFLRNTVFKNNPPIFLSSFTGKICECVTNEAFTFAQLPPATSGLALNISNSNTAGWGLTVASSGANPVLGRYNGTNWTVVAK